MDGFEYRSPIIYLPFAVRTFSTGSIKPHLTDPTIIGQQLCKLFYEKLIVCRRIAIAFCISVPWRKIDAEFKSVLITCLPEFPYNVSLSILPRRVLDGIIGSCSRPETESIVMFCRKNCHLESSLLKRAYPLTTVKRRRVE